jgi:tRNA/rRNA methyltransferase/tRNA (cytidine32/uridine32-2'-O)-methyltransferase
VTAPPILVLVEPQDLVNIASAVRIAKNFGVDRLRLVRPAVFDAWRIEGLAHNTADVIERIAIVDSLEEALADTGYAVALTARGRAQKRAIMRPDEAAWELTARAEEAPVAVVFGREDKGLTNEELDRCHSLVTIATNPGYRSLNLAQAVAIISYECYLAREGSTQPFKAPRHRADPATGEHLEQVFGDWERALWAIDFFKTRQPDRVLRGFRELVFRAELDSREAALLRAMGIEVQRFLERHGVELPPEARRPARGATPDLHPDSIVPDSARRE